MLSLKYVDQLYDLNESISSGNLSIGKEELILEIQMSGLRAIESLPSSMKERAKQVI